MGNNMKRMKMHKFPLWFSDEEIGGINGMFAFCKTAEFLALNAGFALDEGITSPSDVYTLFYAERSSWCK